MARGQEYPSERQFFVDDKTGVNITKLTAFPTVNSKFYFHINAFTPDSKTLVFKSYRYAQRDSEVDVFKVNTDGRGMVQLTDSPNVRGAIVSYDGEWLYYVTDGQFRRVSMKTYEEDTISYLDALTSDAECASMTYDDQFYYVEATLKNGNRGIARFSTDGKEAEVIFEHPDITHTQCEPTEGKVIAFQYGPDKHNRNIWLIDRDGSNLRPLELPYGNGHWMWLGGSKRIMSNLEKEYQGIAVMAELEEAPEMFVNGEHYWHGSCSMDGQWMVSDTNWPDHGIHILNTSTKKHRVLCYPNSSSCHPQWTHPHPSFSPDGKMVVYNSDVSGIPNVYLAHIPDELLAELAQ
ncbi:oligogalacturonate lyase family protein [Paenibacillus sp. UNC451MF]|uniref:oligogalacturonate lyase family protein n=1 Tax=Paenibacillus sp. UNC451MF TaxID=1449063 RepID=UPI00048F2516|nr:oligogalacturonate lyase family protein [Paenibacillus sp. UNC451MF]